jgi:hypothetical protein
MLRYFIRQIEMTKVEVRLGVGATAERPLREGFDEIVIATGIAPRTPEIDGVDHDSVLSYSDVILGRCPKSKKKGRITHQTAAVSVLNQKLQIEGESHSKKHLTGSV